jgi:hypothetical protein
MHNEKLVSIMSLQGLLEQLIRRSSTQDVWGTKIQKLVASESLELSHATSTMKPEQKLSGTFCSKDANSERFVIL